MNGWNDLIMHPKCFELILLHLKEGITMRCRNNKIFLLFTPKFNYTL